MTIVVPETRIARSAKESGGGFEGRCRELYLLMAEIEAQLRGPMGMTSVRWLTSPELALASRTGFAPGDRAGIVEALAMREKDPSVNADVPWALAGLGSRRDGAALQPRRVELDQLHHQAPDPRRGDGRPGADPHPERVR